MNYVGSIVQILEIPKLQSFPNNISRTEFRVQLPQIRKNKPATLVRLVFWGDFAYDVVNYYRINDYILVEGYLAYKKEDLYHRPLKTLEITVFKVYPLFLDNEKKVTKLEELK